MFNYSQELEKLFPTLLRYGVVSAQSPAVMRFFGKKIIDGRHRGRAPDEIISDLRRRFEGVRLNHWINRNSIKMYNKAGSLSRVETTISNTREFKVFRHPNDDLSRPASWQKMRQGVSDLHRRGQVSQACNNRYLEHLGASSITETLEQTAGDICSRVKKKGQTYRALNPWATVDFNMLQFISQGQVKINGFRNKDLRSYLFGDSIDPSDKSQVRKASGRATRRIRLLRGHALVKKVPKTNRYLLTAKGSKVVNAILAASAADTQQLMELAA